MRYLIFFQLDKRFMVPFFDLTGFYSNLILLTFFILIVVLFFQAYFLLFLESLIFF